MTKTLRVQSLEIPFRVSVRKEKRKPYQKDFRILHQNEPLPQCISFLYETLWPNVNTVFKFYEFVFSIFLGGRWGAKENNLGL